MQFLYHENSGEQSLALEGEQYSYIFKVRRHKIEENLFFRNLKDENIYEYKIKSVDRRKALLDLISSEKRIVKHSKKLHMGWCVIDPKSVEKAISFLNETGVEKITFIYCKYSQYKYKPNIQKLEKLLINSSSQCGRSDIIKLCEAKSLEDFLKQNPDSYMLNFSKNRIINYKDDINTVVVGCEGGFSKDEIALFDDEKIVGVNCNMILKSETAVTAVASLILL